MYQILQSSHSGLRWVLLIVLVLAVVQSFGSKPNKKIALVALILTHIQLVIGLGLYFGLSPKVAYTEGWMKDSSLRFFGMEHFLMMAISAILITIAYKKIKADNVGSYKWYLLAGFVILLAGIPWPFREALGAGWF